jgi:hypothetical protein
VQTGSRVTVTHGHSRLGQKLKIIDCNNPQRLSHLELPVLRLELKKIAEKVSR